jgi:hypothetical protein
VIYYVTYMRAQHSSSIAGVTLLEMLVALGIALLTTGFALFGLGRALSGWRLNATARQLVMDLKVVRVRAMAEGVDRRLRFAVPATEYQQQRKMPNGSYQDDGPPTALRDGILVLGCSGAGSSISFRAAGYAGAFGTITLADAEGAQRQVIVDIAGRARVQ